MLAFLDFEASSLGPHSYPIEVGWVFEDGQAEGYLIRPAPGWVDWDPIAEQIHGISREDLEQNGLSPNVVAARMMAELKDYQILASAPSWDGKWLSALLRAAGLPRRALTLTRTDDVIAALARQQLVGKMPDVAARETVADLIAEVRAGEGVPEHRALSDARIEQARWRKVLDATAALTVRA